MDEKVDEVFKKMDGVFDKVSELFDKINEEPEVEEPDEEHVEADKAEEQAEPDKEMDELNGDDFIWLPSARMGFTRNSKVQIASVTYNTDKGGKELRVTITVNGKDLFWTFDNKDGQTRFLEKVVKEALRIY